MRTQRLATWHPLALLALVFGTPLFLLGAFRSFRVLDLHFQSAQFHLWVVGGIAAFAVVVALFAASAAYRSGQHGPVWLALGCLTVGFCMLGHGILTPHAHHYYYSQWMGRLPYAAIGTFAICLALASRPRNAWTSRVAARHPAAWLAGFAIALAMFVWFIYHSPGALSGRTPLPHENAINWTIVVATSLLLLVVARVHWRRYRLGHDPVQFALLFVCSMCTAAMLSMRFGVLWKLSWWDYHIFLLTGFGCAVYTVVARAVRTRRVDRALMLAFDADAMTHLVEGYPEALRSLVHAVELKDAYTAGHSERTAIVAVQLGLRLGVDADVLRAVARGAYLHDVGKISIPDAILNKPGKLTPEERAVIETHPRCGYELVMPALELHESLPAVLHHHERWDGTGYPERLAGTDIPQVARIVAVADVWDAMVSDRAYRAGLAPEAALAHITAGKGAHFDPAVVDAFITLAADWGYGPNGPGDPDAAWQAAQTCHEAALTTTA
jgi:HD-GYP domain-containing protein (c-di-GMP phosphodiesterase class II)